MTRISEDPRIDPRIKALLGSFPSVAQDDVESPSNCSRK